MAGRITGRRRVLVPASMSRDKRSRILDYVRPDARRRGGAPSSRRRGLLDLDALGRRARRRRRPACCVENPSYLGVVEARAAEIARLAHAAGALAVVDVDPSTLGVLAPPAAWGADIACGDIQPLGMHQQYGGGHGGFIASHDDPRIVMEFPSRLFGIAPTAVAGEYGFGDVAYERTSFAVREEGKEWVGTAAALWGITAGVYLALMGPQGMEELGETMMARTRYAMDAAGGGPRRPHPVRRASTTSRSSSSTSAPPGGRSPTSTRALLERGIFSGADLSAEFPELGQAALVLRDRGPHAGRHRPARRRAGGGAAMSAPATPATRPTAARADRRGRRPDLPIGPKPVPRRFHQARWDEPIIFELSTPGRPRRPAAADGAGHHGGGRATPPRRLPAGVRRAAPPALPELSPAARRSATTTACRRRTSASTSTSTSARAPAR